MAEKCLVHNCTQPAVGKGLCRKHYMQVKRHGAVGNTRSGDWGKREKHPAYKAWCGLRRYHRQNIPEGWVNDFWKFVEDVGEKPESSQSFRKDKTLPWSKENFYWKEVKKSSEDYKEYMRDWHRKARVANPDYYANQELQKKYNVTFDWYQQTLSNQNNVCAICKNPETTEIRGKVIAMPVDHCHITGKVRGLLCTPCNRALGLLKDSTESLQAAIEYLKTHS